jgi:hypothetical protein
MDQVVEEGLVVDVEKFEERKTNRDDRVRETVREKEEGDRRGNVAYSLISSSRTIDESLLGNGNVQNIRKEQIRQTEPSVRRWKSRIGHRNRGERDRGGRNAITTEKSPSLHESLFLLPCETGIDETVELAWDGLEKTHRLVN